VAEQPFTEVTVTVYVPGTVTLRLAFVPTTTVPLDHEYVPPPVAVNVIFVVVHVSTLVLGAVIAALGKELFWVIV
jgi:hypothetical protein